MAVSREGCCDRYLLSPRLALKERCIARELSRIAVKNLVFNSEVHAENGLLYMNRNGSAKKREKRNEFAPRFYQSNAHCLQSDAA